MIYHIVIPARMASERLPGKPLLRIGAHSLIGHVYCCAKRSGAASAVIATDSEAVCEEAERIGAEAVMTSAAHTSGSDRIAECADLMEWDDDTLIVNLQGDEPLMPPSCLDQAARLLHGHPEADVASLYRTVESIAEASDPNAVKVVTAEDGMALYFSRSQVPFPRDGEIDSLSHWQRHIGLYAYRAAALRTFTRSPPGRLEQIEKLEQLRFLEQGRRIIMAEAAEAIPAGVDTPEDLERVRGLIGDDGA